MRTFRALMAVAMLGSFAIGCEQEAPKKAPEQKAPDLGARPVRAQRPRTPRRSEQLAAHCPTWNSAANF